MASGMPDPGFERCDGHHETVDFGKIGARQRSPKHWDARL